MYAMRYRWIPVVGALLLSGCAAVDLQRPRSDDYSSANDSRRKEIAELRAKTLADNETYFTNKLRCLGDGETLNELALRVSVSPIYDKTGKVFPPGSTAISDMAMNALSYVKALKVVDTPLGTEISESRVNLLSENYVVLAKGIKDNIVATANKISPLPVGILFPSQVHIAGALVQYDEGTETLSPGIKLDLDAFSGERSVETISVGMQLRLVNSGDGEVLINSEKGKRGSVLLSNKFYKVKLNSSFFRIISTKQYGVDYSVTVEDPKHYVIQEMVEKGIAELLAAFPGGEECEKL